MFRHVFVFCHLSMWQKSPTPKIAVNLCSTHVTFDTLGTYARALPLMCASIFRFWVLFGWWFCRQIVLFASHCVVRALFVLKYTSSSSRAETMAAMGNPCHDNKSITCVYFTVGLIEIGAFYPGPGPIIWCTLFCCVLLNTTFRLECCAL